MSNIVSINTTKDTSATHHSSGSNESEKLNSNNTTNTVKSMSTLEQKQIKQTKLSSDQWDNVETSADAYLHKVLMVMNMLGKGEGHELNDKDIKTCGEDYSILRNMLMRDNILPFSDNAQQNKTSTEKKPKKKPNGKDRPYTLDDAYEDSNVKTIKDAIGFVKARNKNRNLTKSDTQRANTIEKLEREYESVIKNFKGMEDLISDDYCNNTGFHNKYVEFRVITLMMCLKDASGKQLPENINFELASSVDRICSKLDDIDGVSIQLKYDLSCMNNMFKKLIQFSHKRLCCDYPRMLHTTKFDDVVSITSTKAYPNQIDLINYIKTYSKILIILKTMIGGGKTTLAGALASHVRQLRSEEKRKQKTVKTQLLFICSVAPVRDQVGQIVWNMGIGLAVATHDQEKKKCKITMNYNCERNKDNIVVILSDIISGLSLLQSMKEDNANYIVFFDEPTVGADQPNHPITRMIPKLLKHGPDQFILCSATIPTVEQIPKTVKIFTDSHPGCVVKTVVSKTSYIGCEIVANDGTTITPHANSKSVDELKYIIKRISDQPFIGRLYTAPIVYEIHSIMTEHGVQNLPDINKYFSDVKNHSQSKVQELAITLLNCLVDMNDDDLVKKICVPLKRIHITSKSNSDESNNNDNKDEDDDFGFDFSDGKVSDDAANAKDYVFDARKLPTELAYQHMGGCLYATGNPVDVGQVMFDSLIGDKIRLKQLLDDYEKQKDDLKALLSNIDKKETTDKTKSKKSKDDMVENKFERDKKKQELEETNNPVFRFPSHLQINTSAHINRFALSKDPSDFDIETVRMPFGFEDVEYYASGVPDKFKLLLASGIGVYDNDSIYMDKVYLDNVLRQGENGRLAYLIAGYSLAFGVNIPLNSVIGEDSLCDNHSMNTIFQLINRAGRVGKSWVAHAYLGENTIRRIEDYIHGKINTGTSDEAINIELATELMCMEDEQIEKLTREKQIKDEERRQKELEKEQLKEKLRLKEEATKSTSTNSNTSSSELFGRRQIRPMSNNDRNDRFDRNSRNDRNDKFNRNDRRVITMKDVNAANSRSNNSRQPSHENPIVRKYIELMDKKSYIPPNIKNDPNVQNYIKSTKV